MSNRKIEVELLDPEGFTPEGYREWAKANSIGHHVPLEEEAIFIIDGLWIYALTFLLKSWPTDPPIVEQGRPGRWGSDRPETPSKNLDGRSKWRWYLLRTRPEAHGYIAPDYLEETPMRDPKTHAKVLAQREHTIHRARLAAYRSGDSAREERLVDLVGRIQQQLDDWHKRTGWSYAFWANPPYWRYTVLIPDTEEES